MVCLHVDLSSVASRPKTVNMVHPFGNCLPGLRCWMDQETQRCVVEQYCAQWFEWRTCQGYIGFQEPFCKLCDETKGVTVNLSHLKSGRHLRRLGNVTACLALCDGSVKVPAPPAPLPSPPVVLPELGPREEELPPNPVPSE